MVLNKNYPVVVSALLIMLLTGTGCGISKKRLKTIGTIVVVAVAAKLIYDMIIEHQSQQISSEDEVIDQYKKSHKSLPDEPVVVSYRTDIMPGGVVNVGNEISIVSKLQVVRGSASKNVDIQEKIIIFDNEDPTKELKSLTKTVNQETRTCGAYENAFTFKLPKGMPQGVYPIKTVIIVDGKEFQPQDNQMQLVLNIEQSARPMMIAVNL